MGTGPVMSQQPASLTPNMPSPTSLLGAKPCFHAFDCIFFSWMLYFYSLPSWPWFSWYLCAYPPTSPPRGPLVTYTLHFWTFLTLTHLVSFSTYQALMFFCFCLQDTAPLFLFQKARGCKPPTLCCYSVVESSPHSRQPWSVDSLWYHGNEGLENLTH